MIRSIPRRIPLWSGLPAYATLLLFGAVLVLALAVAPLTPPDSTRRNQVASQTSPDLPKKSEEPPPGIADGQPSEPRLLSVDRQSPERRLEMEVYAGQLRQAQLEWEAGNGKRALDILAGCQGDLRNIEFRLLWNLYQSNQTTLYGHTGPVSCVAYSPDGSRIASVGRSYDSKGELCVWNAETGDIVSKVTGDDPLSSVVYTRDGNELLCGGENQLTVCDSATGRKIKTFKELGLLGFMAMSPDGKSVASGIYPWIWRVADGKVIRRFEGYQQGIAGIAYSPDGKRVVIGGFEEAIKVWDPATGALLLTLGEQMESDIHVAFRPDGQRILSAGGRMPLREWDAKNGKPIRDLEGYGGQIRCLSWTPDGKHIVAGNDGGAVTVWKADTGKKLRVLQGHRGAITSLAVSPDGRHLVTGSDDHTVKRWQLDNGQQPVMIDGKESGNYCLAISPDGNRVFHIGPDDSKVLSDSRTGGLNRLLAGKQDSILSSAAFSPDVRYLVAGAGFIGQFGQVPVAFPSGLTLWDARTGDLVRNFKVSSGIRSVTWSPDGEWIATGDQAGQVILWEPRTGRGVCLFKAKSTDPKAPWFHVEIQALAFHPDGARILATTPDRLIVWDLEMGREVYNQLASCECVAWSPNGKTFVTGGTETAVLIWDADTGRPLRELHGHAGYSVYSLAFTPDGKRILTSGSRGPRRIPAGIKVWDATTGTELLALDRMNDDEAYLALSQDGRRLVCSDSSPTLKSFDAEEVVVARDLDPGENAVNQIAYSPDGSRFVTSGSLIVWDAHNGRRIRSFSPFPPMRGGVAWSPDGTRIVSTSWDGRPPKVWDAATGRFLLDLAGPPDLCWTTVAFSPDSRRIVAGTLGRYKEPGGAQLWDAYTGRLLLSIRGRPAGFSSVVYHPDGKRLFSCNQDGSWSIWDADTGRELESHPVREGYVLCFHFGPDGERMVRRSTDSRLEICDLVSGKRVLRLEGEVGYVHEAAYSPNSRAFAVVAGDGIRLWNVETGQRVHDYHGNTRWIHCLTFSPDGRQLVCGGDEGDHPGKLTVWDVSLPPRGLGK